MPFNLINHLLVLQSRAVLAEIDGLSLGGEQVDLAAGVVVAFFEGLEAGGRLALEAEGGGDFGPVEFEGRGALGRRVGQSMVSNTLACS